MEKTFGEAFGELIRKKRGQEQLTQKQLAIKAFDDESKVRRIIEIENGTIRRPQIKTLDPLITYFDISEEELDRCKKGGLFTSEEQASIGLSRQLMENLALRFEHENPDAPDEELFSYLKSKAEELKVLKKRFQSLEEISGNLHNQIAAANSALELGKFDEADEILAAAEELQQEERTLKEVRPQSKIRFARGDAALFNGQREVAAKHYTIAADYFSPFDKRESANVLEEGAGNIYEYERRTLAPDFKHAIEMATKALDLLPINIDKQRWVLSKYRLALLQQVQAKARGQLNLLNDAIKSSEDALTKADDAVENFDYASIVVLRGNCYLARGQYFKTPQQAADISTAIDIFENAARDNRVETPQHRCYIFNSLFAAYSEKSDILKEDSEGEFAKKSMEALLRAIELSAKEDQIDVWSTCQYNLGTELSMAADERQATNPNSAGFLRVRAIAAFNASLEAYPQTLFNPQVASTQLALGHVLLSQAKFCNPELKEIYLVRSIAAHEAASEIFDDDSPQYSYSQFNIGIAMFLHSEFSEPKLAKSDLEHALEFFGKAKSGFKHLGSDAEMKKLNAAEKETKTRLGKLGKTTPKS